LGELTARGLVTCDSFAALRQMSTPPLRRRHALRPVGRWCTFRGTFNYPHFGPSRSRDECRSVWPCRATIPCCRAVSLRRDSGSRPAGRALLGNRPPSSFVTPPLP